MDKWTAIHSFWSSFGLPAHDEFTPIDEQDNIRPPYIRYSTQVSSLDEPIIMSASVYYRDTDWEAISNKVDEISEAIGYGHLVIKLDEGYLVIRKGQPFAQRMNDPTDDMMRRVYVICNGEFLTAT